MELQTLSPKQFGRFRDFIYEKCGMRVDEKKVSMLSHRIRRRLKSGGFADFDEYYRHLISASGRSEIEFFLDAVTTNETFFFRTSAHFDWFKTGLINEVTLAHRSGQREPSLRVWSAACSTGEEAYSLAICLAENSLRLKDWKLEIIGTDISEAVLKSARKAEYKERALEEMESIRVRRWLHADSESNTWTVRDDVRRPVRFVNHNLMEPLEEAAFDCIFIRNVLIYFDRESKKIAIRNLIGSLAPGGYLVVGPSEGIYDMLEPLEKKSPFLYQKPFE